MTVYLCKNCFNFKTRIIKKKHLGNISSYKIKKAIKEQNIPLLGFRFPFNATVYKRLRRHGECGVFYCAENLLKRDLYIDKGNATEFSCGTKPCLKYRAVYETGDG